MDKHTATEQAYKRGFEDGKKAAVRHGRWITWAEAGNDVPSEELYECSACHDAAPHLVSGFDFLSAYCPNCGAKMDLKEGEEVGKAD